MGDNKKPYSRNTKGGSQTFRVFLSLDETLELRSLVRDEEGDADEDVLDGVREALCRSRENGPRDVVLRISKEIRDALRKCLDDELKSTDDLVLQEALKTLDFAVAKNSRNN